MTMSIDRTIAATILALFAAPVLSSVVTSPVSSTGAAPGSDRYVCVVSGRAGGCVKARCVSVTVCFGCTGRAAVSAALVAACL